MNVYERRRAAFADSMQEAVAIVPAAHHAVRNADTEYEYRQNSDFYYLTGFSEPEAVLVITPGREPRDTLFLRPRDRSMEIWTGRRVGVDGATDELGMQAARPIGDLEANLHEYLLGASSLFYGVGHDAATDRIVFAAVDRARHAVRRGGTAPNGYVEPGTVLHEMRLFKSEDEIALMRRAAEATHAGHVAGMRATRDGLYEYELEATIEYRYRMAGARDVAYPSIVAGGKNACTLHYHSNRDVLRDGDLVLVDSGAEFDAYACDVTRTWPVGGRFSPEQRALYEIVLRAQLAGIDEVRPGRPFVAYHDAAVRVLTEGLIDLGLVTGSLDGAIESNAYADFYPHRTGHWLGLDVHDAGRYRDGEAYRALRPGMVMTVEPGLYIQPDLDCDERFKGIGIRIEDDILCTSGEPENLTSSIPKTVAEIEAVVGADVALVGTTRS